MSHKPNETIICPNCGYHATYNYCAECGQETHLHKDTFLGLIGHFVSHYFHYDSKFWKTMKLLWFHPGALTIAYWKKQRNRFIAPISLYIFVSFAFFLLVNLWPNSTPPTSVNRQAEIAAFKADSIKQKLEEEKHAKNPLNPIANELKDAGKAFALADDSEHQKEGEEISEKLIHTIPKAFFFMIPVMAFLLKLLFFRRKDIYFADHAVFSLHYHAFWFSAMLLTFIDPIPAISYGLAIVSFSVAFIYFVLAIKNAYKIDWLKSTLYAFTISLIYSIVLLVLFCGIAIYAYKNVHHAAA